LAVDMPPLWTSPVLEFTKKNGIRDALRLNLVSENALSLKGCYIFETCPFGETNHNDAHCCRIFETHD
jgi:hypothetical protein